MSKIKTDDGTEIGSACSRTHAARHDKIDPRARGFCRCEFGVVHSGRERTYQDDRLELATPRIDCQKPMSIGENPGPPIVHKPPERSIALLCHLREAPIGPAINGGDTPWSMG